jgi:hypothetical protein
MEGLEVRTKKTRKIASQVRVPLATDLPEDNRYEGEALLRIARTRDSLLSLWSSWKANEQGLRGP